MELTIEQLIEQRACASQVKLFREMFGRSVNITQKACICVADKFDFAWAARKLLPAPALAEYERVRVQAWAEYARVTAPAWAEYERVTAPAWAEYERVRAPAWAECARVRVPAWAEYERVRARTIAKLYNSTGAL